MGAGSSDTQPHAKGIPRPRVEGGFNIPNRVDRKGSEGNGRDRIGSDWKGEEWTGKERMGKDWPGGSPPGFFQAVVRFETDWNGLDRISEETEK